MTERRRGSYTLLLASALINSIGSTMTLVAIPLIVLARTDSATVLGIVSAVETSGVVVGTMLSGPLVDRLGPRRLAVLSSLAAALLLPLIPLTEPLGGLSVGLLAGVGACVALVASPGLTCRQLLVSATAEAAGMNRERAGSLYWIYPRLGMVIGAPLTAALLGVLRPTSVIWIDAASFALSGALIWGVPARIAPRPEQVRTSYLEDLRDGLGAVWNTRIVRLMALLAFVLNAVDAPRATVLMPIYLRDIGAPQAALAWVAGTYTVGSLLGLVSYTAVAGKVRGERLIVWLLAGTALAYAALVIMPGTVAGVICMALIGAFQGPLLPIMVEVVNTRTDPSARGRVLSTIMALISISLPVGNLLYGLLADVLPLWSVLLITAVAYALSTRPVVQIVRQPGRAGASGRPAA